MDDLDEYGECIPVLLRVPWNFLLQKRPKARPIPIRRRLISKNSVWRNQEWRLISSYGKSWAEDWDLAPDDKELEDIIAPPIPNPGHEGAFDESSSNPQPIIKKESI